MRQVSKLFGKEVAWTGVFAFVLVVGYSDYGCFAF
jgi:hypothetical protein